jgi:hypothetical protein
MLWPTPNRPTWEIAVSIKRQSNLLFSVLILSFYNNASRFALNVKEICSKLH